MSYIPPHKRHTNDSNRSSPVPDSLVTKFKQNFDFKKSSSFDRLNRIIYSKHSISKWFLIGSNGIEDEISPSLKLVPVSSDSVEPRNGEKPSILMSNNVQEVSEKEERTRWLLVAEKVAEDLVLAYERAKTTMVVEENQQKLRFVASFGKILFYGSQVPRPVDEYSRKPSNKMFFTDVPTSYLQHIDSDVAPSNGLCFDSKKETYTVKISHHTSPNVTISCKCICILMEDGRLSMSKVELNLIRHLVVDVSCVDKNLDMRLMLSTKRKMMGLTEKEISNIKELLHSATVNPKEKGGLRWPLGSTSTREGYRVFETCHVRSTVYKSQTIRLRVRETDRYNERVGAGETKREVALMLKDINTKMQKQNTNRACVSDMLRDALGTLWNFLHCDAYLS